MRTINTDINPNVSNSSKEIAAAVNSAGMNYYLFLVLEVCTYYTYRHTHMFCLHVLIHNWGVVGAVLTLWC